MNFMPRSTSLVADVLQVDPRSFRRLRDETDIFASAMNDQGK
jgi:hypothetical protein